MKINFVIPSTVLGGGLRVVFIYANYLIKHGHEVIVYLPGIYRWEDVPSVNIKTSIANSLLRRNKLPWFDAKFKIKVIPSITDKYIRDADIIIATAWFTARNVYNLSISKGKKVYFIQDYEVWHQDKTIVNSTYKLDMNRIVITQSLHDTLMAECNVESTVIYNGHSSDEFFYGNKTINNPRTIIMLGNFASYKGGKLGLNILARLHKKYGIRIIVFGVTPYEGIPDYVEFYCQPERSSLMSLYQNSDICLFPSKQEAWGLTAIEAMANKVAVVGFSTGCLKEICTDGVNALVIDNGSEEDLEKAVERLILDETLMITIQNNGFELVKNFSWESAGKKFETELLSILNG